MRVERRSSYLSVDDLGCELDNAHAVLCLEKSIAPKISTFYEVGLNGRISGIYVLVIRLIPKAKGNEHQSQAVPQILEAFFRGRSKRDGSFLAGRSNEAGAHTRNSRRGGLKKLLPVVLEDETALDLTDDLTGDIGGKVALLLGLENDLEVLSG